MQPGLLQLLLEPCMLLALLGQAQLQLSRGCLSCAACNAAAAMVADLEPSLYKT